MNQIVPPQFLFRWSFAARKNDQIPHSAGRLLDLASEFELPSIGELNQRTDFACVKLAWNEGGLGISVTVSGRKKRPHCVKNEIERSDGIRIWIDTRNTQTVHRATRFCHHFILLPTGGGSRQSQPIVQSFPVARAREETALPNVDPVKLESDVTDSGYRLDAWFPAEVFTGFDPTTHSRIGFHYAIYDSELGNQTLAVGNEFPYESDPSLWQTIELTT